MRYSTFLLASLASCLLKASAQQQQQQQQGQASQSASSTSSSSSSSSSSLEDNWSSAYEVIEFDNIGFSGYYNLVDSIENMYDDDCTCSLSSKKTKFKGTNAPLNEELSVHFRGPIELQEFGYYVSKKFLVNDESSSNDWSRLAYYNADDSTADNVTFMNLQGQNSTCLGKALTYASSNGTGSASSSTIMASNTTVLSNKEFSIFSNISCSGSDCGTYRSGIPAYHGYYGTTKMFLFKFNAPDDTTTSDTDTDQNGSAYPNMPAIWLLNAHIPRTSQYPSNNNCSCWESGCGEFDIFEVMNKTDQYRFFSTLHTYQETDYLSTGTQAQAYIERTPNNTMTGGVIFDSNGTITVFVNNDTSLSSTISASDLYSWLPNTTSTTYETTLKADNAGASHAVSWWMVAAVAIGGVIFLA